MHILDKTEIELPRIALVGGRRIGEAVAQHDSAAFQARQDFPAHVLGAGGAKQQ